MLSRLCLPPTRRNSAVSDALWKGQGTRELFHVNVTQLLHVIAGLTQPAPAPVAPSSPSSKVASSAVREASAVAAAALDTPGKAATGALLLVRRLAGVADRAPPLTRGPAARHVHGQRRRLPTDRLI